MTKELCECGKEATWIYMPGFIDKSSPFFCDDCVHRGCSCNHHHLDTSCYHTSDDKSEFDTAELPEGVMDVDWKWVDNNTWVYIDEKGREYPCCEYDYDKEGFDFD